MRSCEQLPVIFRFLSLNGCLKDFLFGFFFSGVKSTWVCGSQILAMVLGCLLHLMVFIIKETSCKTNSWYVLILPKYMVEIIYRTVVLMIGVWNTTN